MTQVEVAPRHWLEISPLSMHGIERDGFGVSSTHGPKLGLSWVLRDLGRERRKADGITRDLAPLSSLSLPLPRRREV